MSRVVVISNRVALPGARQTGGLAVSLRQALTGRDAVWLGWSGRLGDDDVLRAETDHGLRLLTFDLGKRDHAEYYNGYVNRVLWPLLHFRTDLMAFDEDEEVAYYRVNRIFARHVASQLRPDDTVWVHDYHLLPLAQELRRLGVTQPIGFFLHVPVAPRDLFATLPGASGLLHSLAAYDHIGVQTRGDLQRLEEVLAGVGMEVRAGVLLHEGRQSTVAAHPIGIDPAAIAHKAERAIRLPAVRTLVTSLSGRALAIGVDRLDYSKGLPHRFAAFGRYLDSVPRKGAPLTYLQIAPTSRSAVPEYRALKTQLERAAGRLNGRHARVDWTPLRYVNRDFSHDTLTGFYRAARIGLVTPLRDGMNLVAKEYLAAQDPDDPGVLVLSRFAGAAEALGSALLVNPHDERDMAQALGHALTLPRQERIMRWQEGMKTLEAATIHHWADDFLGRLMQAHVRANAPARPLHAIAGTMA